MKMFWNQIVLMVHKLVNILKQKSLNCTLQEKSLLKITEKSLKFAVSKYKGHKETQK